MGMPTIHKGYEYNSYPKLTSNIPRAYHKHLRRSNMENIYGKDIADEAESNVTAIEVEPLTPVQEDFLKDESDKIVPIENYDEVIEISDPIVENDDSDDEL